MKLPTELKIGVATRDINPPDPHLLQPTGMGRLVPCRGVLDDLRVEAMAIAAGGQLAFVSTSDLRYLPREWIIEIRQAVNERTGCDPLRILFSSVHNHCSSPMAADDSPEAKAAEERANRKILDAFIEACVEAAESMVDAEIAGASVELTEPVGGNRRYRFGDGTCLNGWGSGPMIPPGATPVGPAGPDSHRVDVLAARRVGETTPMAVMTSYGAHPHLYQLPYFSGEFPAAVKRRIEQLVPGATALHANHTGGDIDLHCVHPMPDGEEAQVQWFADSNAMLAERLADVAAPAIPTDGYVRPSRLRLEYYQSAEAIVNVLAVGDIAIVSIPGELFRVLGEQIHAGSPFAHTVMMSYNGSTPGYTPGALAFEQGSYEVMRGPRAVRYRGDVAFIGADGGTGERIVQTTLQILTRLHEQARIGSE